MKSLYDNNALYTPDATALANETQNAITDIFDKYVARGYSPREIAHIMQGEVLECELIHVLDLKG